MKVVAYKYHNDSGVDIPTFVRHSTAYILKELGMDEADGLFVYVENPRRGSRVSYFVPGAVTLVIKPQHDIWDIRHMLRHELYHFWESKHGERHVEAYANEFADGGVPLPLLCWRVHNGRKRE